MRSTFPVGVGLVGLLVAGGQPGEGAEAGGTSLVLDASDLKAYVESFNAGDTERVKNTYPNTDAYAFLKDHIPFFDCPDKDIEKIYYFRWWTYRKHIKKTGDGHVVTEFLPKVGWSSKHNVISCPAAHQFREGRWLRDPAITREYMNFYLRDRRSGSHRYTFFSAAAAMDVTAVHPDDAWLKASSDGHRQHHDRWKQGRSTPGGLYAQVDLNDGGEWNAGGRAVAGGTKFVKKIKSVRPVFNSGLSANARALSRIASLGGDTKAAKVYAVEAAKLKRLIQTRLWNKKLKFFTILPERYTDDSKPVDVRELIGYVPWYYNLPDSGKGYEVAWKQLMDPKGFYAPFGPTSCEQRHPYFRVEYREGCNCQWNGPSWPYATTQTLVALANLLNNYQQRVVDRGDYFKTLKIYTKSHAFRQIPPKGDARRKTIIKENLPWIDENLDPYTGNWLARYRHGEGDHHGKDYNHSGYCDLIISGLVGLRPRRDDVVVVNPLLPRGTWDWFCLDNVRYHGHTVTILWDKTGRKYGKGKGFMVFSDGKLIAKARTLSRVKGRLAGR